MNTVHAFVWIDLRTIGVSVKALMRIVCIFFVSVFFVSFDSLELDKSNSKYSLENVLCDAWISICDVPALNGRWQPFSLSIKFEMFYSLIAQMFVRYSMKIHRKITLRKTLSRESSSHKHARELNRMPFIDALWHKICYLMRPLKGHIKFIT